MDRLAHPSPSRLAQATAPLDRGRTHQPVPSAGPDCWGDVFSRLIDGRPVCFVRPHDTARPTWVAYEQQRCLGTLHARTDLDGLWHVQTLGERHALLDDAVRALRRPPAWPHERDRARRWAREVLADPDLLVVDIQTTGLHNPWAVQIGAVDGTGTVLIDELVDPQADIEAAAGALHGLTAAHLRGAPVFGALLPRLTPVFSGRRCVAYNASFDRAVLERELLRHHASRTPVRAWLGRCRWEDAMGPASVAKGLWSAEHGTYRNQRLGGRYDAAAKCRALLENLRQVAGLSHDAI
ncbi:exonuclease domain-containing protein [Streptomyces nanhaiensis]|uniref:3'-5' exonuclease n=1 Tax=Streptomyces nanhaiensis TaxID=679319 RepID=UPI00399C78C4